MSDSLSKTAGGRHWTGAGIHRARFFEPSSFLLFRGLSPKAEATGERSPAPLGRSRHRVYGLAALFALDAFGGGFVVNSLLALWLFERFGLNIATAGAIFFATGLCSALSYFAAVPLARRFGLVNTMVFTHLPANVFLVLMAFAPTVWVAFALLVLRSFLSQMDVPTRSSYVMAIVEPEERPAAASVTAVPQLGLRRRATTLGMALERKRLRTAARNRRRIEDHL